ncbi:hypothetical protein EBZ80_23280 [bacterium]|nr:hypothetical protein [bacterium]
MNNAKRYETAVVQLIASLGVDPVANANYRILDVAGQIDDLIFTIAEDSARLSRNLAEFAAALVEVNYDVTPPTQSSIIADITENTGRLRAKREGLYDLIVAIHGSTALKTFRRSLG